MRHRLEQRLDERLPPDELKRVRRKATAVDDGDNPRRTAPRAKGANVPGSEPVQLQIARAGNPM